MIDIRICTADLIERDFNLPAPITEAMFDLSLIEERNAIHVLIQDEYLHLIHRHRKTDIKIILADKYCLSYSTIEKIVAGLNGIVAFPKNVTFPENQTVHDWTLAEKTSLYLASIYRGG